MAIIFTYNGAVLSNDFWWTDPDTSEQYLIPYGNLLVWDKRTLDKHDITVTVTPDVPGVISDRQFFQQLALMAVITTDEALAAVKTGDIPPAMEVFVQGLPADQQFAARMLLSGATQFERRHPMVNLFSAAFGWTDAQLDQFWIAASAL